MNDSQGRAVNALPAAIALVMGLALLLPGMAALAANNLPSKTGHAPKPVSPGTGPHSSLKAGNPGPTARGIKVAENNSPLPTNRGIYVAAGDLNGDGIEARQASASAKGGDKELPGLAGEPIPGVDVNLGKNPGGIVASSKTDPQGAFHFDKLPVGNYILKLNGLPDQALSIGADGVAGGTVMRSPDGGVSIFDRWGKSVSKTKKDDIDVLAWSWGSRSAKPKEADVDLSVRKAGETPMDFGNGNSPIGSGPSMGSGMGSGMGPGAGMGGPMGSPMGPGKP